MFCPFVDLAGTRSAQHFWKSSVSDEYIFSSHVVIDQSMLSLFKLRGTDYAALKALKQRAIASQMGSRQQWMHIPYSFWQQPQLSSRHLKQGVMCQMCMKAIWAKVMPHCMAMQMPQHKVLIM